MKWYPFDPERGYRQKRPAEKKPVLVAVDTGIPGCPPALVVGYRKNAAGEKDCPFFVTPGVSYARIYGWCDCLPDRCFQAAHEWLRSSDSDA